MCCFLWVVVSFSKKLCYPSSYVTTMHFTFSSFRKFFIYLKNCDLMLNALLSLLRITGEMLLLEFFQGS